MNINEDLRKWVAEKWVDIGAPKKGGGFKPCGRQEGEKRKGYPKCVPLAKANSMSASQRRSAVKRKRAAGNTGPKPANVATFKNKKIQEACWKGYKAKGMKKKNGRMVPNCVPVNEGIGDFFSGARERARLGVQKAGNFARQHKGKLIAGGLTAALLAAGALQGGSGGTVKRSRFEDPVTGALPTQVQEPNQPVIDRFEDPKRQDVPNGWKRITPRFRGPGSRYQNESSPAWQRSEGKDLNCVPVTESYQKLFNLLTEADPGSYGIGHYDELIAGKVGPFTKSYLSNTPEAIVKRLNRRMIGTSDKSGWERAYKRNIDRLKPRGGTGFASELPNPAMIPGRYANKIAYLNSTSPEALRSTGQLANTNLYSALKGIAKHPTDFMKSKKSINNSVEYKGNSLKESSPAWQRSEGKDPKGGLNRKGIASYRAANPGSKLSMAVTTKPSKLKKGSKAANRRKSFCARMGGMKKRLTSAKTASDPNSRINKALRKWNC